MAVGIVCEYNPFHNGHKYQIEKAKELAGESVVCVMSGEFVQRGELAIAPAEVRADWARACGADLVLELPYPFSCSSAEIFASAAVRILSEIPDIKTVCFGAEDDDPEIFYKVAEILSERDFEEGIKEIIKNDKTLGYARARSVYIRKKYGAEYDEFLKKPNNILGVEYTKAIMNMDADISILPIKRTGAEHDGKESKGEFCSATYLRENFCEEIVSRFSPIEKIPAARVVDEGKLFAALCTALAHGIIEDYPETDSGMLSKIKKSADGAFSFEEFFDLAKSKHITDAKLRRSVIHILCSTERERMKKGVSYTRVLSLTEGGAEIMKALRKSDFPFLSKISDVKKYDGAVKDSLDHALFAERIFKKLVK